MAWAEQALASADLSDRLPQAVDWTHVTGCRASDLNEEYVNELASFLELKPIPYKRLCKILEEAVASGTLPDGPSSLQEAKAEPSPSDSDSSPRGAARPAIPSASGLTPPAALAPGQSHMGQILRSTRGK